MAGWDIDFDVVMEDEQLARLCFRILRRTCARHYLTFSYYEHRRTSKRIVFMLVFSGRPNQLGLASADFALEMRAVSMVQSGRRRKDLPIRLAHWITYSGSDDPIRLQAHSTLVPPGKHASVVKHLEQYALAWGAWSRNELPAPDFLEAQHSLLTNLAIDLADGVTTRTPYPDLIKALKVPERLEPECLDLGIKRNRVKHRGFRHEAERYVEEFIQPVYSTAYAITGIDAMPRTAYMVRWEEQGRGAVVRSMMFDRWGEQKRFTRY